MKISTYLSVAALGLAALSAAAQGQKPLVEQPIPGTNAIIDRISDNGKWGVAQVGSSMDGDIRPIGGTIFDLETYKATSITHNSGLAGISDITDDGEIVVGECDGVPAYWTKSTGAWTKVELEPMKIGKANMDLGRFNAVTPDGRYAAGYRASSDDPYFATPLVYDLKEGKVIDLPGMPTLDKSHLNRHENALYYISPDGRYVTGMLSQAYLKDEDYAPLCAYVYDIKEGTYDMIGYNDYADKDWEPLVANLHFVASPVMSNNGEWITGEAYLVEEIPGNDWPNESYVPFRYNVKTKDFEVYSQTDDLNITGFSIDNNGVVFGATPASNPYANCVVRSGDYFISLEQIFTQIYGYNFYEENPDYGVTGKPLSISNDGKILSMLPNTETSYILKMPESLADAAAKVKLLGSYSVSPEPGVKMSQLKSITVQFDRNIKVVGRYDDVVFASTDGKEVKNPMSAGLKADGKKLNISFRPFNLTEGTDYTLTIPAGTVAMAGNEKETNMEIVINYKGRANKPVQMLNVTPREDSYVLELDMTSNPVVVTFDTDLKLTEGATAELYRNDETNPYCLLNVAVQGVNAILFPTAGQHLYDGSEYHVVIPAGTLTDISGGGANEEISFSYKGNYIREFEITDNYVFADDCSTYENFMFYEGDHAEPDAVPASWGFTADNPWIIVRDDNGTDMALGTHSMYKPAAKADDWMTITQLLIPDENCYLEFDAQSYLKSANDVLDIYIYSEDAVYNTLTTSFVNEIRQKGDLVFHERLKPGKSEEGLTDDWTNYRVLLDKYAKKPIYISFVNQNDNQSAIFIDNIRVVHDQPYSTVFETPSSVVNQEKVTISGYMVFGSELDTYKSVKLELIDAEGNKIDTIEQGGLDLKKGSQYNFKFNEQLPIQVGKVNNYYVEVSLDGQQPATITGKVANLAFETKRRIVLEEYTGSSCGNCPLGIRAMENIEMLYPGVMIPVTIRTYEGDKLGIGMEPYSQFLGLDAMGAPSAIIDRKEKAYPMISVDNDYRFSGAGITNEDDPSQKEERLWLDVFRSEYETPAEVAVAFSSTLAPDKKSVDVDLYIENALTQHRAAYKVFAVITEDGLLTYQKNYMTSVEDPDLGEWGAGGKYGTPTVANVEAHGVARQTWGTTYNGTAGLFPSNMHAGWGYKANFTMALPETIADINNCNLVVMILDETNKVLNANTCQLANGETDYTGVEDVIADNEAAIGITVVDGTLYLNGEGAYSVNAYDLAGSAILSAKGNGATALPLYGYKGMLLVKATDAEGNTKAAKFIVR